MFTALAERPSAWGNIGANGGDEVGCEYQQLSEKRQVLYHPRTTKAPHQELNPPPLETGKRKELTFIISIL